MRLRGLSLILVAAFLLAPGIARATSVFSMNLVGERLESGDVRAIAMGGSSQLLLDSLGVLSSNTALLARLTRVTIGGSQFAGFDEARNDVLSERDISFKFPAIQVAFPMWRRVTLAVGYRGRYDPDGTFSVQLETASGSPYTQTFLKSGGLFSVPLIVAVNLTRFVSLGGSISFERGFIEDRWDTVFEGRGQVPGSGFKKEEVSGVGYGASAVFTPFQWLILGASVESPIDYDTEVRERFTQSGLDQSYTSTAKLPGRWSAGTTLRIKDWTLAASAAYSDFSTFEGFEFPIERLDSEVSYSLGFEYMLGLFRTRIPLRLGFNYQKLPYGHPQDQQVNKYLFSVGTGIRIVGGKGKLDIAVQGGKQGALSDNGIEDRLVRLYFGLSGGETWQRKVGGER